MPPDPDANPPEDKRPKTRWEHFTFGLTIVAAGLLLAGGFLGWMFYQVHAGEAEISIPQKPLGLGLFILYLGILQMIGGDRFTSMFELDRGISTIRWYEWLVLLVGGGLMVAAYFGLTSYLEFLGYREVHR